MVTDKTYMRLKACQEVPKQGKLRLLRAECSCSLKREKSSFTRFKNICQPEMSLGYSEAHKLRRLEEN